MDREGCESTVGFVDEIFVQRSMFLFKTTEPMEGS